MNKYELIATIVSAVGVVSFATIFTILYRSYATSAAAEYESGQADVELIEETILQNRHSSKRRAEVMRRVKKILSILLVAILIPLLGISLYTKITSGIAMVGGRGWIAVATPSMSMKNAANPYLANIDNQFDAYDMILLERVDSASDLQLYDVIAYVNDEGVNIIHRIVGIYPSTTGVRYITRGDANNVDDKYRPTVDDVLGRYTDRRIPYVGVFVLFLQSYAGIATILAVVYCLFMIEAVGTKIHAAREARLQLLHESIDFRTETEGEDENKGE